MAFGIRTISIQGLNGTMTLSIVTLDYTTRHYDIKLRKIRHINTKNNNKKSA
jgi:hypothetical protein